MEKKKAKKSMIKFEINNFITVKLENDETVIYVRDEKFSICKHLVLNIPINEITSINEIQSIDEIPDRQVQKHEIPPKVEFWGHCSVRHEAVLLNAET